MELTGFLRPAMAGVGMTGAGGRDDGLARVTTGQGGGPGACRRFPGAVQETLLLPPGQTCDIINGLRRVHVMRYPNSQSSTAGDAHRAGSRLRYASAGLGTALSGLLLIVLVLIAPA